MANVKKMPYYQMEPSLFGSAKWKRYMGSEGCVAIDTPQTISLDRLAPGEKPPPPAPKPPKPTKEQVKAQQLEDARQKALAQLQKKQQAKEPPKETAKAPAKEQAKELEAEEHDKIPEFDLQDIPTAMGKMGWPISAKLAKNWFASPKHIYNDQPNSVQPIDATTATLAWALKYGNVKSRFNELMGEKIYTPNAIKELKGKIVSHVKEHFIVKNLADLSFGTANFINDIRRFHIDWQFQYNEVSTVDTLDGLAMTDLTGALGRFNIYAAVGLVEITAEKYFKYDKEQKTKAYCIDPIATVTHVYAYLKDSYSFNDEVGAKKSQYLGHWNKKDMILSYVAGISSFIENEKINMGGSKIVEKRINWDYLPTGKEVDKPVDKRTGIFRKLLKEDVYYPVYNKSYSDWREKHDRGGDFMIYSKPQLFTLKKPIVIKLETVCRPSEPI